ncbi:MAG TPA: ABC transporter ATP-binding protein, partial [Rhodocyclaceae bacterium]|nr:ABC transporter ATP-binding protein [Rhodocyclaceae bacterium]
IVAEGTAEEIRASNTPYVHQFIWGEMDGPVAFQYPAPSYKEQIYEEARRVR